jgi:hypothetical protein
MNNQLEFEPKTAPPGGTPPAITYYRASGLVQRPAELLKKLDFAR